MATARGLRTTLKCGNPDCDAAVVKLTALGPVQFVVRCAACLRLSEYTLQGLSGWDVALLAENSNVIPLRRKARPQPQARMNGTPRVDGA